MDLSLRVGSNNMRDVRGSLGTTSTQVQALVKLKDECIAAKREERLLHSGTTRWGLGMKLFSRSSEFGIVFIFRR